MQDFTMEFVDLGGLTIDLLDSDSSSDPCGSGYFSINSADPDIITIGEEGGILNLDPGLVPDTAAGATAQMVTIDFGY